VLGALTVIAAVLAAAVLVWSGARLAGDPVALARVHVQPLGGTLESAKAFAPNGTEIPLRVNGDELTLDGHVVPGAQVTVDVVVRRPGWLGWALGRTRQLQLRLQAPVATVTNRWLIVPKGRAVRVTFDQPVNLIQVGAHQQSGRDASTVSLGRRPAAGSVALRAAPAQLGVARRAAARDVVPDRALRARGPAGRTVDAARADPADLRADRRQAADAVPARRRPLEPVGRAHGLSSRQASRCRSTRRCARRASRGQCRPRHSCAYSSCSPRRATYRWSGSARASSARRRLNSLPP